MSGLALLLLSKHRASPSSACYATEQLQWAYGLAALDAAYQTLLEKGLVQECGSATTVFHVPRRAYGLTADGLITKKVEPIDAMKIWQPALLSV